MNLHRFRELTRGGVSPAAAAIDSNVYKKDSAPPDYTPVAEASKEAAQIMANLGYEQLDFSQRMYEENAPILKEIAQTQIAAQNQQMEQGKEYYDYWKDTYKPLEQGLVDKAQNFNTEAYRNQLAQQAAADAGRAFNQTRAANERAMNSMGVNPNSGKYQALASQSALGLSANKSNAMTGTRQQAEATGWARGMDAVGLGRNLAGASSGAYAGAINAGNSAGGNQQSAGINYLSGAQGAAGTIGQGQQMQLSGLQGVLNSQTQMAVNQDDSFLGDLGGALGGFGGLYQAAGWGFLSDRRTKENIEAVGTIKGNEGREYRLYEFNYKIHPETRYRGVMADEVAEIYPEAVVHGHDGYLRVDYGKLGFSMEEVA